MQERQKGKEEGGASGAVDSKVSGKVVYSTLPVSVCLPEQHSPTAQRRRGTRGREKDGVKDSGTLGSIKHHKTQEEIQGKRRN